MMPHLPVEQPDPVDADEMQAHGDDQQPRHRCQHRQCLAEDLAKGRGRRAQRDKDHAEAEDEEQRGKGHAPLQRPRTCPLIAQLIKARPAHIGEIGRHQRQHTGRQKAQHARAEYQWQRKFHAVTLQIAPQFYLLGEPTQCTCCRIAGL